MCISSYSNALSWKQEQIKEQMLMPEAIGLDFDGKSFGVTPDQFAKSFSGKTKGEMNLKDKYIKVTKGSDQYLMKWKQQDFENDSDLRINQVIYEKSKKKLTIASSTFNGPYIRTSTFCEGSVINTGLTDKEVYCVTATQKVCRNVLDIYNKNQQIKSSGTSKAEVEEKVTSCVQTLSSYSDILKAFADSNDDNRGVSRAREYIIKQEDKEVRELLSEISDGSVYKRNYINSFKNTDDINKLSNQLTASMSGFSILSNFINLCQKNINNFDPKQSREAAETGVIPLKRVGQ